MSTVKAGPNTVNNGLVFAVDPKNPKSVSVGDTRAIQFEGTKSLASSSSDLDFSFSSPLSFSFWYKGPDASNNVIISNADASRIGLEVFRTSGRFFFILRTVSGTNELKIATEPIVINDSTWIHFTVTYDGTLNQSGAKIYIDGLLFDLAAGQIDTLSSDPGITGLFKVGALTTYLSDSDAAIDNLAIYDKALTSGETSALYNSGAGLSYGSAMAHAEDLSTDLVSWWSMNEISGTRYDQFGGNHLTDNGGIGFVVGKVQEEETFLNAYNIVDSDFKAPDGIPINGVVISGGTFEFDGINDYIDFTTQNPLSTNEPFTLEFWAKNNSNGSLGWIHMGTLGRLESFSIGQYSSVSQIIVHIYDVDDDRIEFRFTGVPPLTWTHYVVTYDGSESGNGFGLYMDTISKTAGTLVDVGVLNTFTLDSKLEIGRSTSTSFGYLDGQMGNTKIYNRVLTQSEITQNYNTLKSRFGL